MSGKFALLLDGGFMTKRMQKHLGGSPTAAQVVAECQRISSDARLAGLSLLRNYWYDARPAREVLTNPLDGSTLDLSKSKLFRDATSRLDTLELSENFALRLGELSVRGWRIKNNVMRSIQAPGHNLVAGELEPAIEQKGVDLRIGLDIARLALRQLVDVIVVVSGDSDIIPAFKFARREGLRVFLHSLGGSVKRDLEAHADVVLG